MHRAFIGKPEVSSRLEGISLMDRMLLKWVLKIQDERMYTGLRWLGKDLISLLKTR
jgi:hypothetical protein